MHQCRSVGYVLDCHGFLYTRVDYLWQVPGRFLGGSWKGFREVSWEVSGGFWKYLEGIWKAPVIFLAVFLDFALARKFLDILDRKVDATNMSLI